MSNIYEQRFFSALKDTFIGHPIKGKSGYVNLMDLKAQYFAEIEPYIKVEIDKQIEAKYREELFEKLYNFFDCYLNDTGTVFFANSQIHKNLYEKVYSDRDDVALFWKTQKLYYVKSEANYEDLQTEVNGINIKFDASVIKHAKGNEKKSVEFYLVEASKKEIVFKVRYKEQNKYDRLRNYLNFKKQNKIFDVLIQEYGNDVHPNIFFEPTTLDFDVFNRVTDARKNIYFEEVDDALESVKVEYSINDLSLMLQYLHNKGIILYEEDLKKIFSIYKRQNEIDYFINKDAEGFLKEQFDIYVYNWLFNDLDTNFDAATVKRMQNIKKITHKVIEYIARFEDELKAIWEKPKFVRNCNYVLTLDRLSEHTDLIEKLIKSPGWEKQIEEWLHLEVEWINDKGEVGKKVWKEFSFANDKNFEKEIIKKGKLNDKYQFLPIDTRFFPDLKFKILACFDNLSDHIDGTIIKTDNWQALKSLQNLYKESVDVIYIDPPFNTGKDFDYKDKYQDSTWLTIMQNRIQESIPYLNKTSNFFLHLDHNADYLSRPLMNTYLSKDLFVNEIIWYFSDNFQGNVSGFANNHQNILWYGATESYYNSKVMVDLPEPVMRDRRVWSKEFGKLVGAKDENGNPIYDEYTTKKADDVWTIGQSSTTKRKSKEYLDFDTQKPEELLRRIIDASCDWKSGKKLVFDYFCGSATTVATAHKMKCRWLTTEMGEHYHGIAIPRLKRVLAGDASGISNHSEIKFTGGGFFKYCELEQYEDVLSKAIYQWRGKEENQVEQYSFLQEQKLLEAIEIDYENKNAKVVFEKLYSDVDIAETLSNLSGKHIKQLFEEKVVFEDGSEVVYADMTFEKYPWIKPLIWWNSK